MTLNPPDHIVEELHAIRQEIAVRFDSDIHRFASNSRQRQITSGLPVWTGSEIPAPLAHATPVCPKGDNVIDAEFKKK